MQSFYSLPVTANIQKNVGGEVQHLADYNYPTGITYQVSLDSSVDVRVVSSLIAEIFKATSELKYRSESIEPFESGLRLLLAHYTPHAEHAALRAMHEAALFYLEKLKLDWSVVEIVKSENPLQTEKQHLSNTCATDAKVLGKVAEFFGFSTNLNPSKTKADDLHIQWTEKTLDYGLVDESPSPVTISGLEVKVEAFLSKLNQFELGKLDPQIRPSMIDLEQIGIFQNCMETTPVYMWKNQVDLVQEAYRKKDKNFQEMYSNDIIKSIHFLESKIKKVKHLLTPQQMMELKFAICNISKVLQQEIGTENFFHFAFIHLLFEEKIIALVNTFKF